MKSLLSSAAILWLAVSGASASASNVTKVDVSVIESVPADASFVWEAPGDEAVPCDGTTCSLYAALSDAETSEGRAGVLKLKFPDGKIVVAECAGTMPCHASASVDARKVQAVFSESSVKVYAAPRAAGGKARAASEMYRVRGVLRPHLHVARGTVLTASGMVSGGDVEPVDAATEVSAKSGDAAAGENQSGRCLIAAEPADAAIYVDGELVGTSPTEIDWSGKAEEQHTVTVQKYGWVSSEQKFTQGERDAAIYVRLLPAESVVVADAQ
jgi:hypothetical protein